MKILILGEFQTDGAPRHQSTSYRVRKTSRVTNLTSVTSVSITGVSVTGVSVTGVSVTGVSMTGVSMTGVFVPDLITTSVYGTRVTAKVLVLRCDSLLFIIKLSD